MKTLNKTRCATLVASVMVTNVALAADIDTSAVVAAITDAGQAIAVVGAAVLVMTVGMKVWKWIQRAL